MSEKTLVKRAHNRTSRHFFGTIRMENNFSSFDILVLRNKLIQKKVENNVDMTLIESD